MVSGLLGLWARGLGVGISWGGFDLGGGGYTNPPNSLTLAVGAKVSLQGSRIESHGPESKLFCGLVLVSIRVEQQENQGASDDPQIQRQRPMVDVIAVE